MFRVKSVFHLLALITIASVFFGFAWYKARHPSHFRWMMPDMTNHLGAEYNCIAKAIYQGRGFSDPFGDQTGPTAWMPPVLPYVLAGSYWLSSGSTKFPIVLMVALQFISILLTGVILVFESKRLRLTILGYLCFVIGCLVNFQALFQTTHDSAWLLILMNLLWLGLVRNWDSLPSHRFLILWGGFGGLCALSSPVFGAVWGVTTVSRLLWMGRTLGRQKNARNMLLIVFTISTFLILPWTLRNRLVLGKWIPIKSNGMYELWQAQIVDDDGVLDVFTLIQHPYITLNAERIAYSEQSEIPFIEEKGRIVTRDLLNNPVNFLNRIANRIAVATIYYHPFVPIDSPMNQNLAITIRRIIYALPLFSSIFVLWLQQTPLSPQFKAALTLCGLTLLPYVLVSYYDRYAIPLVGMKMLLVLCGCSAIRECLRSFQKNIQISNLNQT